MSVVRCNTRIVSVLLIGVALILFLIKLEYSFTFGQDSRRANGDSPNYYNYMNSKDKAKVLILLFTTFVTDANRTFAHQQVIKNWAQFKPAIQPVLFVSHKDQWATYARRYGWFIWPPPHTNDYGTPHLRPMFQYAKEHFDAPFYAFAHGDILFNTGLVDTVEVIQRNLDVGTLNHTLVIGRKANYKHNKMFAHEIVDIYRKEKVNEIFNKSHPVERKSYNYFIVSRAFPWHGFDINVVIAREGIEHYLMYKSQQLSINTVDASETIKAVHISLVSNNSEGKVMGLIDICMTTLAISYYFRFAAGSQFFHHKIHFDLNDR